ncbi:hypothetical protein EQG49_08915 [Periweissella cryptocerci]|uniref:Uncharacterized protein n=1 Tax=Periweissella cryptocerci TaxID=2506420 RepID=A0A4P6YUW1_9LACO|nr:hypothetical protein [Periweissella cryptocerci]QBO36584.1 hypothetical protein EQG49_08915 [Periweissella cryptocerci]
MKVALQITAGVVITTIFVGVAIVGNMLGWSTWLIGGIFIALFLATSIGMAWLMIQLHEPTPYDEEEEEDRWKSTHDSML